MKANELRKGNIVYNAYEGGNEKLNAYQIAQIELMNNGGDVAEYYRILKYIPLTEEWLLKFGFEKTMFGTYFIDKHEFVIIKRQMQKHPHTEAFIFVREKVDKQIPIIIKHVHQLQNLYFALTQEELKINN